MIRRAALLGLAATALAGQAALPFVPPAVDGCFVIAPGLRFCGVAAGWDVSFGNHPDVTAYFRKDDVSLTFWHFDGAAGIYGAHTGKPDPAAIAPGWWAAGGGGLPQLIAMTENGITRGKLVQQSQGVIGDYQTVTAVFDSDDVGVITAMTEIQHAPWMLMIETTSTTGTHSTTALTKQHIAALAQVRLEK